MKRIALLLLAAGALAALAGCGGDDAGSSGDDTLTVYSGREEELVAPLFERFEEETGIQVDVRYGESAELAATIAEEGENTPADVFFAQDPGSLGAVSDRLVELPAEVRDRVRDGFRADDGRWVATSGRSRVIVYNTEALSEDEVPDSVLDLTDPRWKGKVGVAPTNASFQAFVTVMRLTEGDDVTRKWLEDLKANDVQFYEKNTPIVEAVAAGEVEVGLVNHYYLYLVKAEQPDAPIANKFLPGDDAGAFVSVAGAGVIAGGDEDLGERFVGFLLADEQQRFYTEEAEEAEFPVVEGIPAKEGIPALDELEGPEVDYSRLGEELEATLELLSATGYTS